MAKLRTSFLTDRYTFPVEDPRKVRAVCDPTAPLQPEEQAKLHEDLSKVQGGAKFDQIARRIRDAAGTHYARELVTGHAGSGKSTELLHLAAELRRPGADQSYFHVMYVDAERYLSPWNLRLPQIILALVAAVMEEPRVDLQKTKAGLELLRVVKAIAKAVGTELAKRVEKITDLPLLATALQINQEMSTKFGDKGLLQRDHLLESTRKLLTEVRTHLPAEVLDLVFVIDNLEKVPEQTLPEGGSLHDALFVRELPTLDIPAHVVLTYPISLNYDSPELMRAYRGARRTTLPMVAVRESPRVLSQRSNRGPDEAGYAALERLVYKRVSPKLFASKEVVREAVRLSGGCVRDLLRLVAELPIVADPPFQVAAVLDAANEFRNDYTRLLQGKQYVKLLPLIAATGAIPDEVQDGWKREVLLGHVVLEYNSDVWFDVHPLVKMTPSYQAAEATRIA